MQPSSRYQLLHKALSAMKSVFIYAFFFSFVSSLMMLVIPLYSLQVLDRVISSGSYDTLIMLSLITFAAIAAYGLVQGARSFALIRLASWFDKRLAPELFSHGVGFSAVSQRSSATRYLQDITSIRQFISGPALGAMLDVPWSAMFFIVLFVMNVWLGVVALIGAVLLIGLGVLNEKRTKGLYSEASESQVKSQHHAEIASRNSEAIEAMGMLGAVTKRWHADNMKAQDFSNRATERSTVYSTSTRFFRFLVQMCTTGVGAILVLQHSITVGTMIAAGILVGRALAPFEASIASWKGVVTVRKSLGRLMETLKDVPTRVESLELPEPTGKVSVSNLTYRVKGQSKPVLQNVSFELEAGQILGVVGPSAAGKSTLAKLLTGVWAPTAGHVRLDDADVYSWQREHFGKFAGYVPQDVELFGGSVKLNIARMNEEAEDASIIEAAQAAQVHELILHLQQGYETEIGPLGASISAGQRQRIALARAFYGTPKFIVLDEPNANLDSDGELALARAITHAKEQGITVIIISHRPSIMQVVDSLLVLKDGAVAQFGPRDEVLEKLRGGVPQSAQAKAAGAAAKSSSNQAVLPPLKKQKPAA